MKLGCYFMDDCIMVKSFFKEYTIKYSDIERVVYVKWTCRNYFLTIFNPYLTPGFFHIHFVNRSKNLKKHRTAFFRYKNLFKLPKRIKEKVEIIEKIEL